LRILLTGRNGQVGWELERTLGPLGEVIAFDHAGLDLARPDAIVSCVREVKPDVIVNAAAYTAVDKAESEPDLAMAINGIAPGILAEEAKRIGALLVHYSTDYVFDGEKDGPYVETDAPNPLSVYGASKLAGERAIAASGADHLIFRTSWVYANRGKNFLLTILRLAKEKPELRVVADQFGAPTWARDIATATALVLARRPAGAEIWSGIYHLTAAGRTTWHGFAQKIVELAGLSTPVAAIPVSEYPTPARRPRNSVLDHSKAESSFGLKLPSWDAAASRCLGSA
jgi:dTDP-4-dehydrorhamnose reductase